MRKYLILLIYVLISSCQSQSDSGISPVNLLCEYLENPQVIDVTNPRLSWVNVAVDNNQGQLQTSYEIRVSDTREKVLNGDADLWDSGKVNSSESVNIPYEGKPLDSRQECWWQVRTWDKDGNVSDWSEPAFWSMGLLDPNEWVADWIGAPWQGDEALPRAARRRPGQANTGQEVNTTPPPAPLLRKEFNVNKEIETAKAYVTGLGYFEFYVNGVKAGEDVFAPNLTAFDKREGLENAGISVEDNFKSYRVMYLCYDITDMLSNGENVVGAIVGNGFYNVNSNWTMSYGSPRFIGQIYVTYTDGTEDVILTDTSWKISKSAIVTDQVYEGEHYDARLEQPGWNTTGFDDSDWDQVVIRATPIGKMKAHMAPTDHVMERFEPVAIEKIEDGHYIVDFGEEITGWLKMSDINGNAGDKIEIEYVENNKATKGSGSNSYILNGSGSESYAARFSWFVFRYAEIINWPGELTADQLTAESVYTNVKTTSEFETSNELFNQINQIWWRSQTDNMHGGYASDCPHRERSPYTGDGQVDCVTVMHNFDARSFYTKWIQDILGAQNVETGYVPNGAPWQPGCGGGVAWGAAINIMPWEFYVQYGDVQMLENNYEGMKGYVKYMQTWIDEDGIMFSQAPDPENPNRWMNLGDWCAPGELPADEMVHTFYFWRCADFTAKTAQVLGFNEDAEQYAALATNAKNAFMKKYYNEETGSYGPDGGNIFALVMGVPEEQYDKVITALKADIAAADGHLDTGIFGTQFFFEVLAENGLNELAFEAMNKRTEPSYGWWIEQGATTTWERWNGGGSHNHPMFGGGLNWFYRDLAGMSADPGTPGYKHIIFKPQPAGDVTYAKYSNETPYGTASINWVKETDAFNLGIQVPVGSIATVYLPTSDANGVMEGGNRIDENKNIEFMGMEDGYAIYAVGSGKYEFGSQL